MKNFTLPKAGNLSLCLAILTLLLLGACSSPQHFSFRPAAPAYLKQKPQAAIPASVTSPPASAATFTASATEVPALLPEVAALKAAATKAKTVAASPAVVAPETAQRLQKLTLAQQVVIKKLQKQATKLEQKTNRSLDTAAGPVSNRSAIALILIGLVLAIFGALLGAVFYTLGTLLILVGLVLLILNYI